MQTALQRSILHLGSWHDAHYAGILAPTLLAWAHTDAVAAWPLRLSMLGAVEELDELKAKIYFSIRMLGCHA
jgi:hypothetical protein